MNHRKISNVLLDGFTAHSVTEGETVDLVTRHMATSESSTFFIFAEQIGNMFFPKLGVNKDAIDRYVIVLHPDSTADVYLQDFKTVARAKVNRPINAGELIFAADLTDIEEVRFPDIPITREDRVVYFERKGWRFGILFDLTRKTDADQFAKDAARLHKTLLLDDILQITLAELRQAETTEYDAFILTEGKTDWRHLERAFRELRYRRRLRYEISDKERGDAELLRICEHLALEPRERPVIAIFDRDNEAIIKHLAKMALPDLSYHDWGNNVYSLMLPIPDHRREYKNISIEMYYSDEVLQRRTAGGNRLCFDNEIRIEILPGGVRKLVLIAADAANETTKKVASSHVDRIEDGDGRRIGLSKAGFAELIRTGAEPFKEVDFASFRLIAEKIERVLEGPAR